MGLDSAVILHVTSKSLESIERYLASLIAVVATDCAPRVACYALPGADMEVDLDTNQSSREWAAVAIAKALEYPSIWRFHMSVVRGTEVTVSVEITKSDPPSTSTPEVICHIYFDFHRQSPRLAGTRLPDPSHEVLFAYSTLEADAADGLWCSRVTWDADW